MTPPPSPPPDSAPPRAASAAAEAAGESGPLSPSPETKIIARAGFSGRLARMRPAFRLRMPWRPGMLGSATAAAAGKPLAQPRSDRLRDAAARAFARLTLLPVICVVAWLITGLPLLLAGAFLPVPVLLIAAPLATAMAVNVLHRVPHRWPSRLPGNVRDRGWMPLFGLLGTGLVAGGFVGWQLAENSPSAIVTRTPGAAFQAGYWIAQHGSLPIPGSLAAFGGAHAGMHLSSIGFFQQGHSVVPGVLAGLPMLLAGGFWGSGLSGGAIVGPVIGGLAVFTFGGLVGRLAGRQWAPAGAAVLALTAPELYTARNAFSSPAVQLLLFGGLCLVLDALSAKRGAGPAQDSPAAQDSTLPCLPVSTAPDGGGEPAGRRGGRAAWPPARWRGPIAWPAIGSAVVSGFAPERMLGGIGGVALGLTSLLSYESLAYLLPVIVVAGVLIMARRAVGVALCAGGLIGCGYGIAAGYVLARPLADSVAAVLKVIGFDAAGAAVVTVVVIALLRNTRIRRVTRKLVARRPVRWLPGLAGLLVLVALAGLLIRPYVQTVRGGLGRAEAGYVAYLQRIAGLPVDPTRLYSEDTLYWVIWYAGLATVLLGAFGAAVMVWRCLRALLNWDDPTGTGLAWALPLAIVLGGSAAILWQPFTVPDQPWASRRLVPVVIPGLILLATWAAAWLSRRARERGAGLVTAALVAALCAGAMAVPAAATSFGIGLTHSGSAGGLRPTSGGIAQQAVGAGEAGAVRRLCSAVGRSSSVVILDRRVAQDFTQVIRGVCGVPAAWLPQGSQAAAVESVIQGIIKAGRHPVLLGSDAAELRGFAGSGAPPALVLKLATTQDPHDLTQAPGAPWPAKYVIWMVTGGSPAAGA